MNHPTHKTLKAAYSFYNVSTSTPWADLMGDALVLAKKVRFPRCTITASVDLIGSFFRQTLTSSTPST